MVEQNIPKMYETDGTSLEKKIIYQKCDLEFVNSYWLIAELDKKTNIAFGYANLNNDTFVEWGYIDLYELKHEGARPVTHSGDPALSLRLKRKSKITGGMDISNENRYNRYLVNDDDNVVCKTRKYDPYSKFGHIMLYEIDSFGFVPEYIKMD